MDSIPSQLKQHTHHYQPARASYPHFGFESDDVKQFTNFDSDRTSDLATSLASHSTHLLSLPFFKCQRAANPSPSDWCAIASHQHRIVVSIMHMRRASLDLGSGLTLFITHGHRNEQANNCFHCDSIHLTANRSLLSSRELKKTATKVREY